MVKNFFLICSLNLLSLSLKPLLLVLSQQGGSMQTSSAEYPATLLQLVCQGAEAWKCICGGIGLGACPGGIIP